VKNSGWQIADGKRKLSAKRYYNPGSQLLLFVFFGLFDVICAVFLLESLYSACSIDIFLFACIERMAHRADLCVDIFGGTAGLERTATAAANHHLTVFWMYPFFHNYSAPKYLKTTILTILTHISIEILELLSFAAINNIRFLLDEDKMAETIFFIKTNPASQKKCCNF